MSRSHADGVRLSRVSGVLVFPKGEASVLCASPDLALLVSVLLEQSRLAIIPSLSRTELQKEAWSWVLFPGLLGQTHIAVFRLFFAYCFRVSVEDFSPSSLKLWPDGGPPRGKMGGPTCRTVVSPTHFLEKINLCTFLSYCVHKPLDHIKQ